jgi:hypothetical protein
LATDRQQIATGSGGPASLFRPAEALWTGP